MALAPEDGYAHVGPTGAGHFAKMVHNGIEYGLMQAYAEGFEVMRKSEFELDLARDRRHLALRLGRPLLAARARCTTRSRRTATSSSNRGVRRGLGRGPLDDPGGDRRGRARAGDHAPRSSPASPRARRVVRGEGARRAAQRVRRPRGQGGQGGEEGARPALSTATRNPLLEGLRLRRTPEPCGSSIFGASGDLTRRKLFPALYALALPAAAARAVRRRRRRAHRADRRRVPAEMQEAVSSTRATTSTRRGLGAARRGDALRRDRLRDDEAARTGSSTRSNEIDEERGTAGNRVYYLAVPPDAIETLVNELGERRSTEGWTRLIVEKPFGHDLASAHRLNEILRAALHRGRRSSASTTTSARRRSRTCWRCGSRTASSSRSGTGSSSTTSRSRSARRSASRAARRSTSRPA